jgi:hypothetical protein
MKWMNHAARPYISAATMRTNPIRTVASAKNAASIAFFSTPGHGPQRHFLAGRSLSLGMIDPY